MKKRLLTLSIVSLLTLGLASCSDVDAKKTSDGKDIIVSIETEGGVVNYTADDLLNHYSSTETGVKAYYNAIYDVLVRHDQEITPEMSTTIEEEMEKFLNTCKTNASNNGTTYKTELSNSLEAEGVETTGELRELKELSVQKTKYSENFYDQGLEDGTFAKKYIEEKAPYHIRHILIKTDDVAGSSVYNKEISKEESKKIYSIISRLASGKTTFGDIAYDASDDTSNSLYGSVGIMDLDTGFVSEFKYGVYYYDAFLSGKNDTGKTQEQLLEMLRIPSSIELGEGNTLNTKEVLDNSVFTVPYSAVEMFQAYADTTKTIDNKTYTDEIVPGSVRQSITSNYYPRNVLFNTYFNNHGLTFITDEGFGDTTGNANWTTPNAELKAVLGENFDGKILTDNGNPILVTYNPSTGLHFMIIEKSPIYQKYTSYTSYENKSEGEEVALNNLEEELLHYYSLDVPSGSANVTNDNRFVTYIKTTRTEYDKRATTLEDKFKSYDSNMEYKIFESLIYDDNGAIRTDVTIDEKILNTILTYIKDQRANTEYSTLESNLASWTTYLQLLEFQGLQKDAKQLDFSETKLYFADTKDL
ncbi:MAG: hypothetical protein E7180_04370 [Erysipelotrichaceae bacterium]|nr:hypothetical protein [Erysipelotrichaceae bacterium]